MQYKVNDTDQIEAVARTCDVLHNSLGFVFTV